jgi:hypothetical protein
LRLYLAQPLAQAGHIVIGRQLNDLIKTHKRSIPCKTCVKARWALLASV